MERGDPGLGGISIWKRRMGEKNIFQTTWDETTWDDRVLWDIMELLVILSVD